MSSASSSLKDTGRKRNITPASMSLIPTPSTRDWKGASKVKPRDTLDSAVENMATKHKSFSQEASLANPSPMLDSEKERQMTATSGLQCLSQSNLLDQTGSSLKMLLESLVGAKDWFSNKCVLSWKVKVTKFNRSLYQLAPSTRRIEGIEFGLLLTPSTIDRGERSQESMNHRIAYRKSINRRTVPPGSLSEQITTSNLTNMVNGTKTGLKLQPNFVEWMMGFPEGWTEIPDSKLLEMRLSQRLQRKSLKD